MLGANLPYQCDTRETANKLFGHIAGLSWEFVHASYGRTGINAMWNHGPEYRLTGTLGIVIARVPAVVETMCDGTNIKTRITNAER